MTNKDRYVHIDRELLEDPNYHALELAKLQQVFAELVPGTWVAYQKGLLLGTADSYDSLMDAVAEKKDDNEDMMVDQVNIEKPVLKIRSPRIVR